MGPGVRSDLVALGYHALDEIWVWSCGVDGAFAVVIASDEESGCEAICFQGVQELGGVYVRSIVVGKSNDVVLHTIVDIVCVGDWSFQGSWCIES